MSASTGVGSVTSETDGKSNGDFIQSETGPNSKEHEDWQGDRSLVECMQYMLSNQISCDVSFFVGPEKFEVRAHRMILIARSSVFFEKLRKSSEEFRCKVNIPNIDVDTFQRFLG